MNFCYFEEHPEMPSDDGTIMYELEDLSEKSQKSKFIQRVAANPKNLTIIYTPRGQKLERPITQQQFKEMFDCVRELVNCCIIHRDLSPNHFLCTKTNEIFLIDFGSAKFIKGGNLNSSNQEPSDSVVTTRNQNYRGSVRFAAKEILECLVYKYED